MASGSNPQQPTIPPAPPQPTIPPVSQQTTVPPAPQQPTVPPAPQQPTVPPAPPASNSQQPEASRPLSPWAKRYGVAQNHSDDIFTRPPVQHSSFAPYHPKYYGDPINVQGHGVFSSGDEMDRFFYSETNGKHIFHGIPQWQFGPQFRSLQFSHRGYVPGGHIRSLAQQDVVNVHRGIYLTERIEVDESKWFSFFKKSRWWDSLGDNPLLGGYRWTVDDPKIWRHLRVSIELADRILKTLIKERHPTLETVLYGKLAYWDDPELQPAPCAAPHPDAKVLLSRAFMKQRWEAVHGNKPFIVDQLLDTCDEEQWTIRIEHLARDQQWALVAGTDSDGSRYTGVTFPDQNALIILNSMYLRGLMQGEFTLAESCAATFLQTRTILHELAHALMHIRRVEDDVPYLSSLNPYEPDWRKDPLTHTEPFPDFGGSAEMGYFFETGLFGGACRENPVPGKLYQIVAPHKRSWPFAFADGGHGLGRVAGGHPQMQSGAPDSITLIPSLWISKMLSQAFWQDKSIPRKSDNFFHSIDYFRSDEPYQAGLFGYRPRHPPVIQQLDVLIRQRDQGLLGEGAEDMLRDWEIRHARMFQSRDVWFLPLLSKWLASPWGSLLPRRRFIDFVKEFKKRPNQRNLSTCVMQADWLTGTVPWSSSQAQYIYELNIRAKTWPWHAVGLLMLASIPLRSAAHTNHLPQVAITQTIFPSRENPNPEVRQWRRAEIPGPSSHPVQFTSESRFYDPFDRDGQDIPIGSFSHFDYLDQVTKLIKYFTDTQRPVSRPWLNELARVERAIRQQRTELRQQGMSEDLCAVSWLDTWSFKIPEYDPTEHQYSASGDVWTEC
ncbi:hypothetical protein F5Y12DRAFT_716863 [Xylaria sp. FL1777]|nr:hypothetical protein F5Y12DRAFT_716863 [Xylaria sp. FL1777]